MIKSPKRDGEYLVRRPRATDALGESLRHVFDDKARPLTEIDRALRALDRVP